VQLCTLSNTPIIDGVITSARMRFVEHVERMGTDVNMKFWLKELQYFDLKEVEQHGALQNRTIRSFTL
jgi:hypothetical protein